MELYENGITLERYRRQRLEMGQPSGHYCHYHKVVKREGLGDILADRVKKAAEKTAGRGEICRPCRRKEPDARPAAAARTATRCPPAVTKWMPHRGVTCSVSAPLIFRTVLI